MSEKVIRKPIDGGSQKYWQEQREGFMKVTRLHNVFARVERGDHHRHMDAAIDEVTAHPGAVRILTAWRITVNRPYWDSYHSLVKKGICVKSWGICVKSWGIPVFGKERK